APPAGARYGSSGEAIGRLREWMLRTAQQRRVTAGRDIEPSHVPDSGVRQRGRRRILVSLHANGRDRECPATRKYAVSPAMVEQHRKRASTAASIAIPGAVDVDRSPVDFDAAAYTAGLFGMRMSPLAICALTVHLPRFVSGLENDIQIEQALCALP